MRDFIHVSVLADAHELAFERLHAGGGHPLLNCGSGRGYAVRQVLDAVGALAGPVTVRRAPRRPGDAPSVLADTRALRAALPWQPRYRVLDDIVASVLAWELTPRAPERKMAESA